MLQGNIACQGVLWVAGALAVRRNAYEPRQTHALCRTDQSRAPTDRMLAATLPEQDEGLDGPCTRG